MSNLIYCAFCCQEKPQESFKVNKSKCHDCYKQYHRDYQKQYRKENKQKELVRARELYQINKPKVLARKRKDYVNNRDKNIARKLAWQKRNPELCRLSSQRRRAKLYQNGVYVISSKDLRRLKNSPCFYCGESKPRMTFDHIIPIVKGGNHSIGNLLPACTPCNSSKNDKLLIEWKYNSFITTRKITCTMS